MYKGGGSKLNLPEGLMGFYDPLDQNQREPSLSETIAANKYYEGKEDSKFPQEFPPTFTSEFSWRKPRRQEELGFQTTTSTQDPESRTTFEGRRFSEPNDQFKGFKDQVEDLRSEFKGVRNGFKGVKSEVGEFKNQLEEVTNRLEELTNRFQRLEGWKVGVKDELLNEWKVSVKDEFMNELMKKFQDKLKNEKADYQYMIKQNMIPLQEALENLKELLGVERLHEVRQKIYYLDTQHSSYSEFCSSLYLLLFSFFSNVISLALGNGGAVPHGSDTLMKIAEFGPAGLSLIPTAGPFLSAGMSGALLVYEYFQKRLDAKRANNIKKIIQQHSKHFNPHHADALAFDIAYDITKQLKDQQIEIDDPVKKAKCAYECFWNTFYEVTPAKFNAPTEEEFKNFCVRIVIIELVPDFWNRNPF